MSKVTWREVGWLIRGRGRAFLSEFVRRYYGEVSILALKIHEISIQSMPVVWMADAYEGKYDPVRCNIRQWSRDHPTPDNYWEPKNGRPRNDVARAAAMMACYLYSSWLRENKEREIADHGCRREMKDFAALSVFEDVFRLHFQEPKLSYQLGCKSPDKFVEIVRDLMEKPKARRELEDWVEFDFLASHKSGLLLDLPPKPTRRSRR
jgi:hypothetical protein